MLLEELIDVVAFVRIDDDAAAEDIVSFLIPRLVFEQIWTAAEHSLRANRLLILAICHNRRYLSTKIEFFINMIVSYIDSDLVENHKITI